MLLYIYHLKYIIMIGALVTGAGLLGQIYGQYQSSKVGKEKRAFNEAEAKKDKAWYQSEYYRDPTELTQNASFLRDIKNNYKDAVKSNTANAVKAGATPEAQVGAGGALQEKYANAVNRLVGNATNYRMAIQNQYDRKKNVTDTNKRNFWNEEQQSWANFGNNVAGASSGLLKAYGAGAFDSTSTTPTQSTVLPAPIDNTIDWSNATLPQEQDVPDFTDNNSEGMLPYAPTSPWQPRTNY